EAPRWGRHSFVFSVPAGIIQSMDSAIQPKQKDTSYPDQRSGPIRKIFSVFLLINHILNC
ncbi:hypothetical protein E2320_007936, partial [Naja naja]